MAGPELDGYRLTPKAEEDLEDIWLYSRDRWGTDQADNYLDGLLATFETLTSRPEMARERTEFDPPVRIHPTAQHLVVYRIGEDHLHVIRVLGGGQNWRALLDIIEG